MQPKSYSRHDVKQYRKDIDVLIRIRKEMRKTVREPQFGEATEDQIKQAQALSLWWLKETARVFHIAVSELRGRSRDQIERDPHEPPDEKRIGSVKKEMRDASLLETTANHPATTEDAPSVGQVPEEV